MQHFNFGAGPAALPKEVVEAAKKGLTDWDGYGQSVMEIPFTGDAYSQIYDDAVTSLRTLLKLPDGYKVLFLQGGAYGQFSILPMNLLRGKNTADYAVTGHWSQRAAKEAEKYCTVNRVIDETSNGYTQITSWSDWSLNSEAAYCHITTNETANGIQIKTLPETGTVPLVADVTSDFLTAPIDIQRFGAIYASAQKNAGTAGLTVVIVKQSLLGAALPITPTVFDYGRLAENNSKINTPPVWSIYIAGLVYRWIIAEGGLNRMAIKNKTNLERLYQTIDKSEFYRSDVSPPARSSVNICFNLPNLALEKKFLLDAEAIGLHNLKGHSDAGGIRISLYNAVTDQAVEALDTFMQEFMVIHSP